MKLVKGQFTGNKTSRYFIQTLMTQPKEVIAQFVRLKNSKAILGIGVQDYLYNDAKGIEHTIACLFIVVDRNGEYDKNRQRYVNPKRGVDFLNEFLSFIRTQECYIHDYIFDSVAIPEQHCIVLYMGEEWHKAYDNLIKGQYSKMYSLDDLKKCKIQPGEPEKDGIYYVLTHNSLYFPFFKAKLKKQFNLSDSVIIEDDGREYDTSFLLKEETFNYRQLSV